MTLGSDHAQTAVVDDILSGRYFRTAEEIREVFLDERPTVALAIFPLEQYTGTITTDLFAEGETSYFDDAEQFFELQRKAVEQVAEEHRESAAWVEVTEGYRIPAWQYRKAEKGEAGGVVINLSPYGQVEVREGLLKSQIDEDTATETADNPLAPPRLKASYTAPLRRYVAHHKSMAVQEMLLASPRKAREVAAVHAITALEPHGCIDALSNEKEPQDAYKAIATQALLNAAKLGLKPKRNADVWSVFPPRLPDEVALYEAVKALSDHELDELHTLLAALSFGQMNCDALDTQDSLFNRVAKDRSVDMKNHWRPDRSFLQRRNRKQLSEIGCECGYAEGRSGIGGYKKSELVSGLLKHFKAAHAAANPTQAQQLARDWLPEVMRFPAIDPDATDAGEDDAAADE